MRHNKLILACLLVLLVFAFIPSKTGALLPNSFDQAVDDYYFLKCTVRNNSTSAVTGYSIPSVGLSWMIEIDSIVNGPPWDIVNGSVYQETSGYLDIWQPTSTFGAGSFEFGRYNNITPEYLIGSKLESLFPVPFIIPLDMVAVFNYTINESLSAHFEHYMYLNGTAYMEQLKVMLGEDFAAMIPFDLYGIVIAYNGSDFWIPRGMGYDPIGNNTGNVLLVAVYFDDGELNYLRESWWDNTTLQSDGFGTWRTMYKLVSPTWELFGAIFEGVLPGSGGSMGGIPGFPCTLVFVGLLVSLTIVYLRKPKNEIIF